MSKTYGELTESAIGILMREVVSRVMQFVRESRHSFIAKQKGTKPDGRIDWVTDIDVRAQVYMIRLLRENFPTYGIVAEEEGLSIPAQKPTLNRWFSFDPIDGTRAFVHHHSHGISVMLALMEGDRVIASIIGNVMTNEVLYFRPGSKKTHQLDRFSENRLLNKIDRNIPLAKQYLLLRDPAEVHDEHVRRLIQLQPSPLFEKYESTGGSIGLSMSRLWTGEVGGAILRSGIQKPWDICPVIGFTQRLGFTFFSISIMHENKDGIVTLWQTKLRAQQEPFLLNTDVLVIHKSRIPELAEWCIKTGMKIEL